MTFSPVRPSPRVAPIVKRPSSYCNEIASPSSFGSATKRIAPGTSFSMRVPHATSSSRENALSSDSIGARCSTGANVEAGRPPGRCVGESGVDELGMLLLDRAQLAHERVELGVGDLGRVEHEVLLVVVLDQRPQLLRREAPRPVPLQPRRAIYPGGVTTVPLVAAIVTAAVARTAREWSLPSRS